MKHLKLFLNDVDYQNYAKSDDYIKPNVSYAKDTDTVYYNPLIIESYKMVDLGLPSGLKWADRNVGASSPEDAGLYFMWGDTVGYTEEQINTDGTIFDWPNYPYTSDNGKTFTKYNATDKLTVLEASDDAATVHMGSEYRTPTKEEIEELINNTTYTFYDVDGNEAYSSTRGGICKFTGANGNSILVPKTDIWYRSYDGRIPCFTSSSSSGYDYDTSLPYYFAYFAFNYGGTNIINASLQKILGLPVRGVCN
jgi:hypothetical protein